MNHYATPSQNFPINQYPAQSSREFMQNPGLCVNVFLIFASNHDPLRGVKNRVSGVRTPQKHNDTVHYDEFGAMFRATNWCLLQETRHPLLQYPA